MWNAGHCTLSSLLVFAGEVERRGDCDTCKKKIVFMWSKEFFNCSSYQMISRAAIAFAIQNLLTFELLHSLADLPGSLAGSVAAKAGNFEAWNKTVNNMNVLLRWLARLLFLFRKSCNNINLLITNSLLKIKLGFKTIFELGGYQI